MMRIGKRNSKLPPVTGKKAIRHLITITEHKVLVARHCFQMGLYLQGLTHDLSKYTPAEFWNGVRFFRGNMSPNAGEIDLKGYSDSWLHHKGRNKHHFEYWVDFSYQSDLPYCLHPVRMPRRYVAEMIADRVAACKVYRGKDYRQEDALAYYNRSHGNLPLHPETRRAMEYFLNMIAEEGEEKTFAFIRHCYLQKGMTLSGIRKRRAGKEA